MFGTNLALLACAPAVLGQAYIQQKLGIANGEPAGTFFGEVGMNRTFDYVIIGGGLAGSVVANRLAENPDVTVAGMHTCRPVKACQS